MPTLRFRAHLIDPILSGRKVQTLRARIPHTVACAEVIDAACRYDRPAFARLAVVSIDRIAVADLTRADARRDNPRARGVQEAHSPDAR